MSQTFTVYAHLTPTSRPKDVSETLKLIVKGTPRDNNEESKDEEHTIKDIVDQIMQHLEKERNDGNKVYEILNVATSFGGDDLERTAIAATELEQGSDIYVTVRITIDTSKHVEPISQVSANTQSTQASSSQPVQPKDEFLKYKTITKYSYYESGDKWVKVLLPDLAGLANHPKDKIKVEFPGPRTFTVKVDDLKGENL